MRIRANPATTTCPSCENPVARARSIRRAGIAIRRRTERDVSGATASCSATGAHVVTLASDREAASRRRRSTTSGVLGRLRSRKRRIGGYAAAGRDRARPRRATARMFGEGCYRRALDDERGGTDCVVSGDAGWSVSSCGTTARRSASASPSGARSHAVSGGVLFDADVHRSARSDTSCCLGQQRAHRDRAASMRAATTEGTLVVLDSREERRASSRTRSFELLRRIGRRAAALGRPRRATAAHGHGTTGQPVDDGGRPSRGARPTGERRTPGARSCASARLFDTQLARRATTARAPRSSSASARK